MVYVCWYFSYWYVRSPYVTQILFIDYSLCPFQIKMLLILGKHHLEPYADVGHIGQAAFWILLHALVGYVPQW